MIHFFCLQLEWFSDTIETVVKSHQHFNQDALVLFTVKVAVSEDTSRFKLLYSWYMVYYILDGRNT